MPITFHHLRRLVPHPPIDQALVEALRSTGRAEGVPEYVPSSKPFPRTVFKYLLEVMARLIIG